MSLGGITFNNSIDDGSLRDIYLRLRHIADTLDGIHAQLKAQNEANSIVMESLRDFNKACAIYDKLKKHNGAPAYYLLRYGRDIHEEAMDLMVCAPYPFEPSVSEALGRYLCLLPELRALPWSPKMDPKHAKDEDGYYPKDYCEMPRGLRAEDDHGKLLEVLLGVEEASE